MKMFRRFFKPSLIRLEDRLTPSAYVEPLVLGSNPATHVLDITLTAHQSQQFLETLVGGNPTSILTSQFLTYGWTLNDGTSSNLSTSGDSYPGPTLKVDQGDTLRIRLENNLQDLVITPPTGGVPVTEQPINNHVHGLHISPVGSSDNVLVTLPPGEGFVYEYKISENQPDGLFWIHNHRHEYTSDQVYRGLSSLLVIGDSASNITELASIPHRTMALQFQLLGNQGISGQFIKDFTGVGGGGQFTVNGLVNSTITVGTGQTEVWSLANMSPNKNIAMTLTNTTTNTQLPLIVVGQDGVAYGTPVTIPAGQSLFIPSGARYSILVTASSVSGQNVALTFATPGVSNTLNMTTDGSTGTTLPTPATLTSDRFFEDLSGANVVITDNRTQVFSINPNGGGQNAQFEINGQQFPNPPLSQPRLDTVEQWTLINNSTVAHPFHIHVNDFQVMSIFSPTGSLPNVTTPQLWDQDVVNIPPALQDSNGNVIAPGTVVFRTKPTDFTGAFVFHCHILPHEDRGMMALVTTQPATPVYAAGAGPGGGPEVSVFSSVDNSTLTSFFAFEEEFQGGVDTAVADVNNDGISDLIVGAGAGGGPRVRVFNGATNFTTDLFDFFAFNTAFTGGVDVAGGDFNADGFADIVVGAGPGGGPMVRIFDGRTGTMLTEYFAYDLAFTGGVTVAVGDLDGSGFNSLVTGAGPGGGPHVRSWRNSRFYMVGDTPVLPGNQSISLNLTGEFFAYETSYTGGVQVSTGLNAGASQGGFDRILTGTLNSGPRVTVWEAMVGHDAIDMATPELMFEQSTTFFAFDSTETSGVRVGSVAISTGSDFLAATGTGTSTLVRRYSLLPGASQPTLEEEFFPFTAGFEGGANLGGTN